MSKLTSIFARNAVKSGNTPQYTKRIPANKGYRADCNIYFKSSMEANFYRFIRYLMDQRGFITSIYYEPYIFKFPKNSYDIDYYVPDFEIKARNGCTWFVETKGYMDIDSIKKIKLFRICYPDKRLIIYDGSSLESIKKYHRKDIPNWE